MPHHGNLFLSSPSLSLNVGFLRSLHHDTDSGCTDSQVQVQQDWFSLKQAQMTRIIALGPTLGPTPCLPRPPGSLAHHQHDPSQGQVHPSPQYYHCPGLRTMPTPDPLIFSHCQPPLTPGCTVVLSEPTCDSSFCYIL